MKPLDESWNAWVNENIARGCDTQELLSILLRHEFDIRSIRTAMGIHFPEHSPLALAAEHREAAPVDLDSVTNARLTRAGSGAVRFDTPKMQLYLIDKFLSGNECDEVVAIIDRNLRPSTVTIPATDKTFRTSRTSDLSRVGSPIVARLDDKIARAVGIRPSYSEDIQAQRYDVGQQFGPHTDFFEPGTSEYLEFGGGRGNRTWTFMVYLNDVEVGGATYFVALDHVFSPVKGTALAWNNLRPDGTVNRDTMHAGMPVIAGHKIIITKWFRERGMGAMRYDD